MIKGGNVKRNLYIHNSSPGSLVPMSKKSKSEFEIKRQAIRIASSLRKRRPFQLPNHSRKGLRIAWPVSVQGISLPS